MNKAEVQAMPDDLFDSLRTLVTEEIVRRLKETVHASICRERDGWKLRYKDALDAHGEQAAELHHNHHTVFDLEKRLNEALDELERKRT